MMSFLDSMQSVLNALAVHAVLGQLTVLAVKGADVQVAVILHGFQDDLDLPFADVVGGSREVGSAQKGCEQGRGSGNSLSLW